MDLASIPLALVAPITLGQELSRGVRLVGASSELGLQLRFEVRGADVYIDIEPIDEARPYAARSNRFQYSYRTSASSQYGNTGRALCEAVARLARANEHAVFGLLKRLAAERPSDALRIREVRVAHALETWGSPGERYYTLSPYVGCLIGCRFCYAQTRLDVLRRMQGLPDVPWGSWVDARMNIAERLADELRTAKPWPVKFCPIVSDPYHVVERKLRLTRACLAALKASEPARPVIVLTRSAMIRDDIELIGSLPQGYAGMSLPTADDEVRRHFEPRAASISERLETLRALRAAGARVFAIVQPLLPGDLVSFADALAESVESVRIDVLHGLEGADAQFADPRFADAAKDEWQLERAEKLASLLEERQVKIWPGELPPDISVASRRGRPEPRG